MASPRERRGSTGRSRAHAGCGAARDALASDAPPGLNCRRRHQFGIGGRRRIAVCGGFGLSPPARGGKASAPRRGGIPPLGACALRWRGAPTPTVGAGARGTVERARGHRVGAMSPRSASAAALTAGARVPPQGRSCALAAASISSAVGGTTGCAIAPPSGAAPAGKAPFRSGGARVWCQAPSGPAEGAPGCWAAGAAAPSGVAGPGAGEPGR